jgi:class 3 adenylate cyclase
MRYPMFHFRWKWTIPADPMSLWPLVADTNHFNRDTGVPAVERLDADLDNARQRLRLYRFGVPVEWEEEPFEWVRPFRFGVMRRYTKGPVASMRVLAELEPRHRGSTRLVYRVWARPRTALGLIAIPVQIGLLSARRFDAAFRRYGQIASRVLPPQAATTPNHLAPGARRHLLRLGDDLTARGAAPDLVARLIETIERGDDVALARMRPYALADAWGRPRRAVLELCLLATRAGLLELSWNVLCPLCRGAKESSASLNDIPSRVHCSVCHIDVAVNFDRFVEVTFHPSPRVRPSEVGEFCVGGPQLTPHIVAQQLLPAGATRTLTLPLEEGRYRLRTLALPGGQPIAVAADGAPSAVVRAAPDGWPHEELRLSPRPVLHYENATDGEQLFVLERMAWSDQATTAAEVTALQSFRDLFASEALRPGQEISVGGLAVLFTDLRDSTRLYRHIGDAPAFGLVMDHFDVLREAIAAEDGAIVKTIGDAVMAVFRQPVATVRATLRAQRRLANPPEGTRPLLLKAGIHYGPCIAVTLNDRLDYFGSTINIAARLASRSSGTDVVLSSDVRHDPDVDALLAGSGSSLTVESLEATLKGLDDEPVTVWHVTPATPLDAPGDDADVPNG